MNRRPDEGEVRELRGWLATYPGVSPSFHADMLAVCDSWLAQARVIEAARRYVLGIDVNKAINEEEVRRLNQGQTVTMLVGGPPVDPLADLRAALDALAARGEPK